MALSKQQKEAVMEKLSGVLHDAETVAFVHFKGLSVGDTTTLRKTLKANDVGYTVVKKTLLKRALSESGIPGDIPALDGEVAIAYGPETAPAREVYAFAKKREEQIALLGGVFEGAFMDRDTITAVAQIPSLDVLRGMFVNLINSPIQRFAIAMGEIAKTKA